jgi:hypothetical protein
MSTAPRGSRARHDVELLNITLQLLTRVRSHAAYTTSANREQRLRLDAAALEICDVMVELNDVYEEWMALPAWEGDDE